MENYQKLALVGGIYGITLLPVITALFAMSVSDDPQNTLAGMSVISILVSIIFSILPMLAVFLMEDRKKAGTILIISAVSLMIMTNISGLPSWALFFIAGIFVIKINAEKKMSESSPDVRYQDDMEPLWDTFVGAIFYRWNIRQQARREKKLFEPAMNEKRCSG